MATVVFDQATRIYPGSTTPAVNALDLRIEDGELLVLVGPSGCGKSTSLRMLAGLEDVDEGTIWVDDRDVTTLEPKDRDMAMVFQNYALYPHMTVAKNMGFALRTAGVSKSEIDRRVKDTAQVARPRPIPRPQTEIALGRAATAGRHGQGDCSRASGFLDGRTALQSRCQTSRPNAHADRVAPRAPRRHDGLCHARSSRSNDHG